MTADVVFCFCFEFLGEFWGVLSLVAWLEADRFGSHGGDVLSTAAVEVGFEDTISNLGNETGGV